MRIDSVSDFRRAIKQGPYAWPGGYECFFVANDGEAICYACAKKERRNILDSVAHNIKDGWRVVSFECSANFDDVGDCAHCSKSLNAYSED